MGTAFEISRAVSMALFLFYGISCLFSRHMEAEFERYGLSSLRKLTGALEVAGAVGLLAGYFVPVLLVAASAGLALLMLLGIATRIRIRDPLWAMSPAIVLFVLNVYVFTVAIGRAP